MDKGLTIDGRPRQRKAGAGRKRIINEKNVRRLRARNMTIGEIAKIEKVNPASIYKCLKRITPIAEAIKQYNENKADVFIDLNAMTVDRIQMILDSVTDESIKQLPTLQRVLAALYLTKIGGIVYDKWRLETGQSTENIAYYQVRERVQTINAELAKYGIEPQDVVSEPENE